MRVLGQSRTRPVLEGPGSSADVCLRVQSWSWGDAVNPHHCQAPEATKCRVGFSWGLLGRDAWRNRSFRPRSDLHIVESGLERSGGAGQADDDSLLARSDQDPARYSAAAIASAPESSCRAHSLLDRINGPSGECLPYYAAASFHRQRGATKTSNQRPRRHTKPPQCRVLAGEGGLRSAWRGGCGDRRWPRASRGGRPCAVVGVGVGVGVSRLGG